MADNRARLIEHAFPLKQASLDSVHEKNVRHGHISTLHIWPARRPLAACRDALIATLLPDPGTPEARKKLVEKIFRQEIRKAYGGRAPKVLDPFAGGGAIPLEAMRLGCEATASTRFWAILTRRSGFEGKQLVYARPALPTAQTRRQKL